MLTSFVPQFELNKNIILQVATCQIKSELLYFSEALPLGLNMAKQAKNKHPSLVRPEFTRHFFGSQKIFVHRPLVRHAHCEYVGV